MSAKRPIKLFV